MITVRIEEMQRNLAGHLVRVQAGETLVVVQADKSVAHVKPVPEFDEEDKPLRPFALAAGQFTLPADFDDPLPDEILSAFVGR